MTAWGLPAMSFADMERKADAGCAPLPSRTSRAHIPLPPPYKSDAHLSPGAAFPTDETCPISTEGWTKRVHFVREGGGWAGVASCSQPPPVLSPNAQGCVQEPPPG